MSEPRRLQNSALNVVFAVVLLVFALGAPRARAADPQPCRSPQEAARALLDQVQPDRWRPTEAAACLDLPPGADGPALAVQLKSVLDARGLYVPVDEMSLDPDYTDATGGHRVTPLPNFAALVIQRSGDRWLWSRALVEATPRLHRETFSGFSGAIQRLIPSVGEQQLGGVHLWQLLYSLLLLAMSLGAGLLAQRIVADQFLRLAARGNVHISDGVVARTRRPISWFAVGLVAHWGIPDLQLHVQASRGQLFVANAITSLAAVLLAVRVIDVVTAIFARRAEATESKMDDQVIPLVSRASKSAVWIFGVVFVIQNLGVDVGSLLAGVGLGGLAVALAARDTLENLFGSLTVFTDRPFQIGDWVVIGKGEVEGVIEEVGFRSTRVRTFANSVVSVPNAKVANSTVDNMGKRRVRRVRTTLGLTYDTPPERIEAFVAGLRRVIAEDPQVFGATQEVHFAGFGASALEVMVYFFLDVPDWQAELEGRSRIYLAFLRVAEREGVRFAFPSTSLYIEAAPPGLLGPAAG